MQRFTWKQRRASEIAYTTRLHTCKEAFPMSAAQAMSPSNKTACKEAELAGRFLYFMSMMREMEDRIERKLYRQGKIVGGVYVGRGQEAIPVGSALHARPEDVLFPSHRDMAVYF